MFVTFILISAVTIFCASGDALFVDSKPLQGRLDQCSRERKICPRIADPAARKVLVEELAQTYLATAVRMGKSSETCKGDRVTHISTTIVGQV